MRYVIALLILMLSAVASAQPIHGHPQKAAYASPSEYPTGSAQFHWRIQADGRTVPDTTCTENLDDLRTCAHLHADLKGPLYREMNAGESFAGNMSITLHHFPGCVFLADVKFDKGAAATDVIWDATGSSQRPVMCGEFDTDHTYTGSFSVPMSDRVKGWWGVMFDVRAHLNDGTDAYAAPLMSIWSTQNPTGDGIAEAPLPIFGALTGIGLIGTPFEDIHYGQLVVEYGGMIPLAPINQPWEALAAWYSYDGRGLPPTTSQVRRDLDLHHSEPGVVLLNTTQIPDFSTNVTFDPRGVAVGPHKFALVRQISDTVNNLQLAALFVTTIQFGEGAGDPPPTCTDPTATNFGGPLPCVYPPPPPTEVVFSPVFKRVGDLIKACDPADQTKCLTLGTMVRP